MEAFGCALGILLFSGVLSGLLTPSGKRLDMAGDGQSKISIV
jgi:hypothetical protein